MRHRGGPPGYYRGGGPGRHLGFRLFGFLFFLLFASAVIGGFIALVSSSQPWLFLLIGALLILIFGFVLSRVFRTAWAPISDLIDATARLGGGDTSVRLSEQGRGPWSPVSRSFNNMATRLEAEDERRRRLLADLGHEMRTPLAVIRGEIEAIIDGVHDESALQNVVDEVEIMERLLEDLRTLAMTEAGRLELEKHPADLSEIAEDVVASFATRIAAQQVHTELHRSEDAGEVFLDPHRIHQVLSNLISNALAQMPDGGTLRIEVRARQLSVSDTGPGITDEELDKVFDRFEKGADSAGSGLGLSIARDLIEAHGGTILAENNPGGGAVFTFTLPDQPPGVE